MTSRTLEGVLHDGKLPDLQFVCLAFPPSSISNKETTLRRPLISDSCFGLGASFLVEILGINSSGY